MTGYALLFDLDMVLADWSHRLPLIQQEPPDREAFYAAMPADPPIPAGVVLYNMLITQAQIIGHAIQAGNVQGAEVPFVDVLTCRPERTREVTMQWFVDNGLLAPRAMHMREDLDVRPHHLIKLDMYRKHYDGKEEVLVLFEDNADTIKAFRDIGITVYQVCESGLN
jgi:hypothetical protein